MNGSRWCLSRRSVPFRWGRTATLGFLLVILTLPPGLTLRGTAPAAPHTSLGHAPLPWFGSGLRKAATPPSHAFAVDPTIYYYNEPAPMGIGDFGVNPASGRPYTYNTTAFLGVTTISSLSTTNSTLPWPHVVSIQLNVNFQIHGASGTFTYWIQDVAFYNTSSRVISFIDNVWNLSSSGAMMSTSDIKGNGTIGTYPGTPDWYYDQAGFQAGNGVALPLPTQVSLLVVSKTTNGRPGVAFEYNDGSGWQTYDNIYIVYAQGYSSRDFVVDGVNYDSAGLFNDAELIFGGPGGGSQTKDVRSSVTLSLAYYNGHNYQLITNAYNFGSNTAEGISNVQTTGGFYRTNGTIYDLVNNGSGSPGGLYNRSVVAILNVSCPVGTGTLSLNGTSYGTFVGSDANVTIGPGTYFVEVDRPNGSVYGSRLVTVGRGAYVPISITPGVKYRVAFTESGLPVGVPWNVTLNGSTTETTAATVDDFVSNGTYNYSFRAPGYQPTPGSGSVVVNGADVNVAISFSVFDYAVDFTEAGLPSGTPWNVTVNGVERGSTTDTVAFAEPNGSYTYSVGPVAGYQVSPTGGVATVNAAAVGISLNWTVARFSVSFVEAGLPYGRNWSVTFNGATESSVTSSVVFTAPNGTYAFRVDALPGFTASPWSSMVTVAGRSTTVNITVTPFLYTLEFTETGLPVGTNWSVTIGDLESYSTGSSISVGLPNGTYAYLVSSMVLYLATPSASSATVAGSSYAIPVVFTAPTPPNGHLTGTLSPSGATLWVNGTIVSVVDGTFNLSLAPGVYAVRAMLGGYIPFYANVSITAGNFVVLPIALVATPTTPAPSPASTSGLLLIGIGAAGAIVIIAAAVLVSRRGRRDPP